MSKVKGATHTRWSHHDTMVVNLKDWVKREIETLRNDISAEAPKLSPSTSKLLKSAEDMNTQLFDLIRSVVDVAEAEAKKKKPKEELVEAPDEVFDG